MRVSNHFIRALRPSTRHTIATACQSKSSRSTDKMSPGSSSMTRHSVYPGRESEQMQKTSRRPPSKLKDAIYTGTRDVRTFAELSHAADTLMRTAREYRRGNLYTLLSSLLLRTFTFEAYLNHLGERILKLWDAKKHLRWFEKFTKICRRLNFTPSKSKRPYSTLRPLFNFRNLMAHGKSETIIEEKEVNSQDADKYFWLLTKWEKFCTFKNVERAKKDITAIIIELHKQAGCSDDPFAPGEVSSCVTLKQK